jgi:Ca-activated chloride channel family protein
MKGLGFTLIALAGTVPALAHAQVRLDARVREGTEAAQPLPVVHERLRARIDRQHADTWLESRFQNTGERQEGRFAVSLGEGALVNGFAYWNGTRKIVGEVFEKQVAEEVYGEITGLGRDPGLFEQVGEGAFSFRIFPIEAGEEKRVEVRFARYLASRGHTFEYRVPLAGTQASIDVELVDDRAIAGIHSPSHAITTRVEGGITRVSASSQKAGDFVLRVTLRDEPWALRARVHRDAGQDAYVALSLAVPEATKAAPVVAKDVTIVIDHSGSMSGAPLAHALAAARQVIGRLRPTDRLNVIIFDDDVAALYAKPRLVDDAVRGEALAFVDKVTSDGGTDIARALEKTLASQLVDAQPDVVLFLTDGQSDSQAALRVARADAHDVRLFTVGLGDGVEKPLLARLAAEKRGRFTFIAQAETIEAGVGRLFTQIESPVLLDVSVEGEGLSRIYPRTLPDLAQGEELKLAARLDRDAVITVRGTLAGARFERQVKIVVPRAIQAPWVGRQWAQARVDDLLQEIALLGETDELKNEALELALAYDLVTPYTSFLALPEEELTDAAREQLGSARERKRAIRDAHKDAASLSRDEMPPGDPVLSVRAPRDARQVTAYFPFGLDADLGWDAHDETWKVRFLVPLAVPDGEYFAKVVIVHADGSLELAQARYVIDSSAPDFVVEVIEAPGGIMLRVTSRGPAGRVSVALVGDARQRIELAADGAAYVGFLALPLGTHQLRVVVADKARNEGEQLVDVSVE